MPETPPYPNQIGSDRYEAADVDQDVFFTSPDGYPTVVTGGDLEAAIPTTERDDVEEIDRYWAVYPYSYVSICRNNKDSSIRYYVVEPYLSEIERSIIGNITESLRSSLRNADSEILSSRSSDRRKVIREGAIKLLHEYNYYQGDRLEMSHINSGIGGEPIYPESRAEKAVNSTIESIASVFTTEPDDAYRGTKQYLGQDAREYGARTEHDYLPLTDVIEGHPAYERVTLATDGGGSSMATQPPTGSESADAQSPAGADPTENLSADSTVQVDAPGLSANDMKRFAFTEDDSTELTEYQARKVLYYLERNFVGFKKIDAIKNDLAVEDITCNGYDAPVFVYHTKHEQVLTNCVHGRAELDRFVTLLAQFAGKEISRRNPESDVTLPDGSRAQLTLGTEVSDEGTNYTIRQFKDIPFTPVDLINWGTYDLDQMARLWFCAENERSILVAGGTASGKTTTLNALSLFISPTDKVVSIEDTREIQLPQRNWTPLSTRESTAAQVGGDIDEYDLLESSLRRRPDYLLMGEVRGEEGRTLMQIMATGHSCFTTFHASSPSEVVRRFVNEPINVSKALFEAVDIIAAQKNTTMDGESVRRAHQLTEVDRFDGDRDQVVVRDISEWDAETDTHRQTGVWGTVEELRDELGWTVPETQTEIDRRKAVLAYLVYGGHTTYAQVSAAVQAYMIDKERVMELVVNDYLGDALPILKDMGNVEIATNKAGEEMIPRPSPSEEGRTAIRETLAELRTTSLSQYRHSADWQPDYESLQDNFGTETTDTDSAVDADSEVDEASLKQAVSESTETPADPARDDTADPDTEQNPDDDAATEDQRDTETETETETPVTATAEPDPVTTTESEIAHEDNTEEPAEDQKPAEDQGPTSETPFHAKTPLPQSETPTTGGDGAASSDSTAVVEPDAEPEPDPEPEPEPDPEPDADPDQSAADTHPADESREYENPFEQSDTEESLFDTESSDADDDTDSEMDLAEEKRRELGSQCETCGNYQFNEYFIDKPRCGECGDFMEPETRETTLNYHYYARESELLSFPERVMTSIDGSRTAATATEILNVIEQVQDDLDEATVKQTVIDYLASQHDQTMLTLTDIEGEGESDAPPWEQPPDQSGDAETDADGSSDSTPLGRDSLKSPTETRHPQPDTDSSSPPPADESPDGTDETDDDPETQTDNSPQASDQTPSETSQQNTVESGPDEDD